MAANFPTPFEPVVSGMHSGLSMNTTAGAGALINEYGITAHAGGGAASAYQLNAGYSRIATVASAADSVILPAGTPGMMCIVTNAGANAAQVFGKVTADKINGTAAATGISLAAGKTALLVWVYGYGWSGPVALA